MSMSRRDLLRSGVEKPSGHVASLVIQCRPDHLDALAARLAAIPDVEVPLRDEVGKLVVLLDLEDESDLMARVQAIEASPGVISATPVYNETVD